MEHIFAIGVIILTGAIIGAFKWCFDANVKLSKMDKIDKVDEKLDMHSDALAKMLSHQEMAKAYYEKIDDIGDKVEVLQIKVAKLEEK